MGTRGTVGFVIRGEEKLAYNHFDSYPSGLGVETLKFLRGLSAGDAADGLVELSGAVVSEPSTWDELRRQVSELKVVSDKVPPTADQIADLREFTDLAVGNQTENDWYNLLRGTQGDWGAILRAGYMQDGSLFPLDSLFCEWAYVIDLDKEVLEVYEGFQNSVPTAGRWAGRPTAEEDAKNYKDHLVYAAEKGRDPWRPEVSEFKAIELVATYPLNDLPTDADFCAKLDPPDEDDESDSVLTSDSSEV